MELRLSGMPEPDLLTPRRIMEEADLLGRVRARLNLDETSRMRLAMAGIMGGDGKQWTKWVEEMESIARPGKPKVIRIDVAKLQEWADGKPVEQL